MPPPLDFEVLESLRKVKNGLDLVIDKLLPRERPTAISTDAVRDTDDYLHCIRQEIIKLLAQDEPPKFFPHQAAHPQTNQNPLSPRA